MIAIRPDACWTSRAGSAPRRVPAVPHRRSVSARSRARSPDRGQRAGPAPDRSSDAGCDQCLQRDPTAAAAARRRACRPAGTRRAPSRSAWPSRNLALELRHRAYVEAATDWAAAGAIDARSARPAAVRPVGGRGDRSDQRDGAEREHPLPDRLSPGGSIANHPAPAGKGCQRCGLLRARRGAARPRARPADRVRHHTRLGCRWQPGYRGQCTRAGAASSSARS